MVVKEELSKCQQELSIARQNEQLLLEKITVLENRVQMNQTKSNEDVYMVGSSILREVKQTDIVSGTVRSISGGKISDIKADLNSVKFNPKTIITYVGGNDLIDENKTVESVSRDHGLMLIDAKSRFPNADIIDSGLVPRTEIEETRIKVKDFNQVTKEWCNANSIKYIENEDCFELKSGDIDISCHNMSERNPAVHLNRRGTIRLLENISKHIPHLKLSQSLHKPLVQNRENHKKSYAQIMSRGNHLWKKGSTQDVNHQTEHYYHDCRKSGSSDVSNRRRCYNYNCGDFNHNRSTCKYDQKLRCKSCFEYGHKQKFCKTTTC